MWPQTVWSPSPLEFCWLLPSANLILNFKLPRFLYVGSSDKSSELQFHVRSWSFVPETWILRTFQMPPLGNEGIATCRLLPSTPCLLHCRLHAGKLALWFRSPCSALPDCLLYQCQKVMEESWKPHGLLFGLIGRKGVVVHRGLPHPTSVLHGVEMCLGISVALLPVGGENPSRSAGRWQGSKVRVAERDMLCKARIFY